MSFQILGFDVLLDKLCKPYFLEVNHAPSFATDSPIDYEIKHSLFVDTFRLLDLSVAKKRQKLTQIYEDKKARMMTKLTMKQKIEIKKLQMESFAKGQDEFEKAHLGKYERIFPLPVRQAAEIFANTHINTDMSKMEKDAAQQ